MSEPSGPEHERYMARALELARAGVGLASPNPCVGAVVVDRAGNVIGEGTHTYDARKHAEVLALEQAGERARGATLYLNLEPCSHQGRTGPCADAVVAAGVKRVFAAMGDPNPLVSGRGFEKLRAAGIEVHVGLFERDARKLNEAFAKWIRTKTPLVTLKSAMTLDGKIAPADGERTWITGDDARAHVHQLRHASDAILVGVGTVIADDPLLTDRSGRARRRKLLRVVLDSKLRIPMSAQLVTTAADDVVVFCCDDPDGRRAELERAGVRVERVSGTADGLVDLREVMSRLGELQVLSVLVEGGALVNATAIRQRVADKLFLYCAPRIMGSGVNWIEGAVEPVCLSAISHHEFGADIAIEGYFRDPYA